MGRKLDLFEQFGNLSDGQILNSKWNAIFKQMSDAMFGGGPFIIQDTETLDSDKVGKGSIYEIGAIYYDGHQARVVHHYVGQKKGFSFDRYKDDHFSTGFSEGFQGLRDVSDEMFNDEAFLNKTKKYNGATYISPSDFGKWLQSIASIPNLAYNAFFDLSREKEQFLDKVEVEGRRKNLPFNRPYDIMVMAADLYPEIMGTSISGENSVIALPKVYKYLWGKLNASDRKRFGFVIDPYNSKFRETHKALEDVMFFTVPVTSYLFETLRKKIKQDANYNINNYEGLRLIWEAYQSEADDKKAAKTGFNKKTDPINAISHARLHQSGSNAKGIYTNVKLDYKITDFHFKTVNNLIVNLDDKLVNGTYLDLALGTLKKGKTSFQRSYINKMSSSFRGNGQHNLRNMLNEIDRTLRSWDIMNDVVYSREETAKGTILKIHMIPKDPVFLTEFSKNPSLDKLPTITIPMGNDKQILSHYNMQGINQWKQRVMPNNEVAMMLSDTAQVVDLLSAIQNKKGYYSFNKGDYKGAAKQLQNIIYQSRQTVQVAGMYVGDEDELINARAGTGSEAQLNMRKRMVDFSSAINHIVSSSNDITDAWILKENLVTSEFSRASANQAFLEDIQDILLACGTARTAQEMKKEIAAVESSSKYSYITNSNTWKSGLRKYIESMAAVGIAAGTSQENAFNHLVYSTMSPEHMNPLGFLLAKDKRHVAQVGNIKELHYQAQKTRKGMSTRHLYTAEEVAAGIPMSSKNTNAMFSYGFVTPKEVDTAWKQLHDELEVKYKGQGFNKSQIEAAILKELGSRNIGAVEGGTLYVLDSETPKRLLSVNPRTAKMSYDSFEKGFALYCKNKKINFNSIDDAGKIRELQIKYFKSALHLSKVDIDPERFSINPDGNVIAEYLEISPMESGLKLLSDTDQERSTYQGITSVLFRRIIDNKFGGPGKGAGHYNEYDFLKEKPDTFKYNQLGGLVGGALYNILEKIGADNQGDINKIKSLLTQSNFYKKLLQGCVEFRPAKSKKNDWFIVVTKPDEISRRVSGLSEDEQTQVFNWINELGKMSGVLHGQGATIFQQTEQGFRLNTLYRGLTQVGQYAGEDYTGVGKKNTSDFRFVGGLERSVSALEATSGQNLSTLKKYLLSHASPSKANQELAKSLRKESKDIYNKTLNSIQSDTLPQGDKIISVGYGSQYTIDLNKYKDSKKKLIDLSDAYKDGHIIPEKFDQTILGEIDKLRRDKAKKLNLDDPSEIDVFLDLGTTLSYQPETGGKGFYAQRLYIPHFTRMNNVEEIASGNKTGYDLPSYMQSYNRVFKDIERAADQNMQYNNIDSAGQHVWEAIQSTYAFSHEQKNAGHDIGTKTKLAISAFNLANSPNPATLVFTGEENSIWREIATNDAVMHPSRMKDVLQQVAFEASDTKEQRREKTEAHVAVLYRIARSLFQEASFVERWNYYNTLIDPKMKNKKAYELINSYVFTNQNLNNLSDKDLVTITKVFAEFITFANTIESEAFNDELRLKNVGLDFIFSRFPYSNGLDPKFIQIYASSSMGKKSIQVGFGSGIAVNLDVDGDIPPAWFPLLEATMGREEFEKLFSETQVAKKYQRHTTELVAAFNAPGQGNQDQYGNIENKDTKKLLEFRQEMAAAILGKSLKVKTGELSNLFQLITNGLLRLGMDESGLSGKAGSEARRSAVLAMLVRSFFERITQDAISSKKIFDRLSERAGQKVTVNQMVIQFAGELTELLKEIKNLGTYGTESDTGIRRIIDKATIMGLISNSPDRISVQVIGWAYDLFKNSTDKKRSAQDFKDLFGVDINKLNIQYDNEGHLVSIAGMQVKDFVELMNNKSGKEAREKLFGSDFKMDLSAETITKSLLYQNSNLKARGTNLGEILRNYGGDLDKGLSTISKLGVTMAEALKMSDNQSYSVLIKQETKNANVDAKVDLTKLRRQAESLYTIKTSSLKQFIESGEERSVSYVPVTTGAGHVIKLDSNWLADDKTGYKRKLKSNIDYSFSATTIAGALHRGEWSGDDTATRYGTLHHKIVETCIKDGLIAKSGKKVDKEKLRSWLIEQYNHGGSIRQEVSVLFDKEGKLLPNEFDMLYNTTNSFFKVAGEAGVPTNVIAEQTHGIVIRLGGKTMLIGGTIDELWRLGEADFIGDAKTSSYPYLSYVIQLSLYNAIVRALHQQSGQDTFVSPVMKLFMTPKTIKGFYGSVINVNSLSDNSLFEFIEDALQVILEKNHHARELKVDNLLWKWSPILQKKRGDATAVGDTGMSWSNILKNIDSEYPLTPKERDYLEQYKAVNPGIPFEEWLATARSKEEYLQHQRFMMARGQYVQDWLNKLSSNDRIIAEEYIRNNAEKAKANKNYILSNYLYYKENSSSMSSADKGGKIYSKVYNESLNKYVVSELKTKEEQEEENMEKALLESLAKIAQDIQSIASQGLRSSSGSDGSFANDNAAKSKAHTQYGFTNVNDPNQIGGAILTAKELAEKAEKSKNAEMRESLLSESNAIAERLLGSGSTVRDLFGEDNQLLSGEALKEKVEKDARESIIKNYFMNNDADVGLLDKGMSEHANTQTKEISRKAEEDLLKKTEQRLKLYKELYELQKQMELAAQRGNKEEEKRLRLLSKEKQEQEGITSKELAKQIKNVSPRQLADLELEVDEQVHSQDTKERERAKRQYLTAIRNQGRTKARIEDYRMTYGTTYDKIYKQSLLESTEREQENLVYDSERVESAMTELKKVYNDKEIQEIIKQGGLMQATMLGREHVKHKGKDTLWGQLSSQMSMTLTRFTQMGAAYKIIGNIRQGINTVIQSAKNLDKELTNLRIVTGKTGEEARNTMGDFAKLAGQLGVTTTEVAQAGTAWLRQGYDMAQTTDLITSSMYLARLGMISVDEATKGLTSTLKGFKLEASEAMDVVDKLTALDVKAATTAGEIATGLAQFANLANLNGISTDQAAAMVATIADVSQVSGAQAGNSLKMMLSRYGNVKSGKFDAMEGEGDTEALNDVEKVLNKIGISMRDANNSFREFDDVLEDISEKWSSLDNISQNAVASAVAGTRQREAFLVLMQNMDKYHDFTKVAENSEGTAYKKYLSYQEQLEASQKRLTAAWEELSQDTKVASFLTGWTNFLTRAVKTLPYILRYSARLLATWNAYKIPSIFKGIGNFAGLTGKNGIMTGLSENGIKGAVKNFNDVRTGELEANGSWFAQLTGYKEKQLEIEQQITLEKQKQLKLEKGESTEQTQQTVKSKEESQNKSEVAAKGQEELQAKRAVAAEQISSGKLTASFSDKAKKNLKDTSTLLTIAMGTLTTIMTAGGTNKNLANNGTSESSDNAKVAQKVTSGVLSGAGGVVGAIFGGPFGAMLGTSIGGVVGDALNPLIGGLIDAERDARNYRVELAEKQLKQLNEIDSSVKELSKTINTNGLYTYQEMQEINEAAHDMIATLTENWEVGAELVEKMRGTKIGSYEINSLQDLYTVLNNYNKLSTDEQQYLVQKFTAASSIVSADEYEKSLENEKSENKKTLDRARAVYNGDNWWSRNVSFNPTREDQEREAGDFAIRELYAEKAKARFGEDKVHTGEWWDPSKVTIDESVSLADLYEFNRDFYDDVANNKYNEVFDKYRSPKMETESTRAAALKEFKKNNLDAIGATLNNTSYLNSQINSKRIQSAILNADIDTVWGKTALSNLNQRQLRSLGSKSVIEAVTKQIIARPDLFGLVDTDVNSEEGQELIRNILKENEQFYNLFQGTQYSLSEALESGDLEVINNFATALSVSEESLRAMVDDLGDMQLGQIIELTESLEKARDYMKDTSSYLSSIAGEGLNLENLEKLFKDYPELVKYVNDPEELQRHLMNDYLSGSTIYGINVLNQLLDDTETYDKFYKENLTQEQRNALDKLNYSKGSDVTKLLSMSPEDAIAYSGLSESELEDLKQKYTNVYKVTYENDVLTAQLDDAKSYSLKLLDKQLENLNAQKQALQEINKQREYENKLVEAQLKLGEAAEQKRRVWREGVGWVYESDQSALAEAEKNVEQVNQEKQVSVMEMQIQELTALKDDINRIAELLEFNELEKKFNAFASYFGVTLKNGTVGLVQALTNAYQPENRQSTVSGEQAVEENVKRINELKTDLTNTNLSTDYMIGYTRMSEDFKMYTTDEINQMKTIDQIVALFDNAKYLKKYGSYDSADWYNEVLTQYRTKVGEFRNMIDALKQLDPTFTLSDEVANYVYSHDSEAALAEGTLGFSGGLTLLNEEGTEAIITPAGTMTALPSKSGVVPADITKNVWQLGELAPSILRALGYPSISNSSIVGGTSSINNTDSVNIGTITMNVSADSTFDSEKFIQTLKQQASLNKNTRR